MPKLLAKLSRRRTPYVSSIAVLGFMLVLALTGNIGSLARATSVLLLICFMAVNVALVVLKYRKDEPKGRFEIPYVIPVLGALVCALMLSYAKLEEFKVAGAILTVILILYFVIRPSSDAIKRGRGD